MITQREITVASQVIDRTETFTFSDKNDLTGYVVSTSKPAALFVGNPCTNIPKRVGGCDAIHINPLPLALRQESYDFYAPPISGRPNPAAFFVRVMAHWNNTQVYEYDAGWKSLGTLNAGDHLTLDPNSVTKDVSLRCSQPCMAIQQV